MFRSTSVPSPIEEAVIKATDENLTSENWDLIMSVCDKVNANPEYGSHEAVQALQKRLAHGSGNVQLFSLALTESLAQNCGPKMQREMASRTFTQSLVRMGSDRTVHTTVKLRLLEVMGELVNAFKGDATLDLMSETLEQIKSMNSQLQPQLKEALKPARPAPLKSIEDEELEMALALSLQESKQQEEAEQKKKEDEKQKAQAPTYAADDGSKLDPNAPVTRVKALYDLTASGPGELSFRKGDVIFVLEDVYHGWWRGSLHGHVGIFPLNYVSPMPDTVEDSVDADEEGRVFAEAQNIDRLLSLISNPNTLSTVDSSELERLYKSTMAIRPGIIKLIDQYGSKKEDMAELNERFKTSMQKYEGLLDSYVHQYNAPQTSYGANTSHGLPSYGNHMLQPSYSSGSQALPSYGNVPQPSYSSGPQALPSYGNGPQTLHGYGNSQQSLPSYSNGTYGNRY
ncbi:hypothetical protein V1512DRAFT_260952 [Lipomyces arxii]|uniref:uncharacterized protein n=1 Tax=Lipomyces arxii TaxID=56418 RepID=UPI0034CD27E2